MPNKRKDSKKHVGLWLEPEEIQALKDRALRDGITVAEIIRKAFSKYEQENPVVRSGRGDGKSDRSASGSGEPKR